MESLDSLRHLIQAGDWFTKIDLKDAYLTAPVRECDQKFLCFSLRSRFYSFTSLPFGLSSAPRVFTKLCRPIAAHFCSGGIRLLVYLVDWLLMAQSKDQAVEDFENVSFFFEKLGFLINHVKSCGAPVQVTEHLGLIINSNSMSFALPED